MFHIDGLRVDAVASMLYLDYDKKPGEWVPNSFGTNENLEAIAFIKKLNENIHKFYPDVLMIAEESTAFPYITRSVAEGGLGFDYKWNMGWMNDTLEYMKTDPLYRGAIHDKITFQMTYIFSEKFILALSHDEVVHGKASLLNKMPGDYERKFAGLKTYLMYMMSHPGKKLIFMGAEFGQFIEWNENQELDWMLLDYESHRKLHNFTEALNQLYLKEPAFYDIEDSWDGFKWIVVDDRSRNVFVYCRISMRKELIIVILNFSFLSYDKYIINLEPGKYKTVLNSEDKEFGGNDSGSKIYKTDKLNQITVNLKPISGLYLKKIKEE
jgi:1,4-alpha-glucan branching enzyme